MTDNIAPSMGVAAETRFLSEANDVPSLDQADAAPDYFGVVIKPASQPKTSGGKQDVAGGLKQIGNLAASVSGHFKQAAREIERINLETKILSLNAQIESARAGVVGNAFGVVATAMVRLSGQTTEVTHRLATETQDSINSLNQIITSLGVDIRGTRLSDLAMTNIDVIDRNLYERSCAVRWRATDSSAVAALTQNTAEAREHASKRLGVILDSFTVYFDIVLCDLHGRVIANGRKKNSTAPGLRKKTPNGFRQRARRAMARNSGFRVFIVPTPWPTGSIFWSIPAASAKMATPRAGSLACWALFLIGQRWARPS